MRATRDPAAFKLPAVAPLVRFGASPRAAVHFTQAARATAALAGRAYVLPEDVKEVAMDVLRHRLILSYDAEADNVSADEVVAKILAAVPYPDVPSTSKCQGPTPKALPTPNSQNAETPHGHRPQQRARAP